MSPCIVIRFGAAIFSGIRIDFAWLLAFWVCIYLTITDLVSNSFGLSS